jgi:hypothetical protein
VNATNLGWSSPTIGGSAQKFKREMFAVTVRGREKKQTQVGSPSKRFLKEFADATKPGLY